MGQLLRPKINRTAGFSLQRPPPFQANREKRQSREVFLIFP
jgi:hypothetical protein